MNNRAVNSISLTAAGTPRVGPGLPSTAADRRRALDMVREYVQSHSLRPPLSLEELQRAVKQLLRSGELRPAWREFLAVLVNNETWREHLSAVPFDRRLLLLPRCLRHPTRCRAELDELGLVCRRCGSCLIQDLQSEAERLGYVVLVAEGATVVTSLVQSGQVEAVVGVSCMGMLEKVFPYMVAAAVPALAIPLLRDGCTATEVDADWVWEAIAASGADSSARVDVEALRRTVAEWFTPAGLAAVLGEPRSQTQRLALDWLAVSGKRWRPVLAASAYQCLAQGAPADEGVRRIAVAVECFHKASLAHDDIEDGDARRYGRHTLHRRYGVPVALNIGDLLLGEGYRLLSGVPGAAARRAALVAAAAEGHRLLAVGQGEELWWRRRRRALSVPEVLDIFRQKTAPAFEVALRLGALYAGAAQPVLSALAEYSRNLGIAYQVHDDLADLAAGRLDGDLRQDRPSLLAALAKERANAAQKRQLRAAWRGGERGAPGGGPGLLRLIRRLEAPPAAQALREEYLARASAALDDLQNSALKGLLRRVMYRIFHDEPALECCREHRAGHAGPRPGRGRTAR